MASKMERTKTPGIYKKGNRYVVVWTHKGRQHKEFFRTYTEAREAKGRRAGGEKRAMSRELVLDYFERWIDSYGGRTSRGFEASTRQAYRESIEKHGLPYFGGMRLRDVGPQDVREWYRWCERRAVSAASIRKARAPLSAMFATAKEDGRVQSNPVAGVRYVPSAGHQVEKPKPHALTAADVKRILGALPDEWVLFFELLTYTGVRIGEALGLTWRDVRLGDDPRVHIREQLYRGKRKKLKTDASVRVIPLSTSMARKLAAIRPEAEDLESRPVFASKTGTPLSYGNVYNRVLHPALRRCGLAVMGEDGKWDYRGVGFHAFRKACGSLLLARGDKNVKQVQGWLGHARLSMTLDTYVHEVDGGLGSADVFDDILGEGKRGQGDTREEPQDEGLPEGMEPAPEARITEQPQTAAESWPYS